jgi:crotonobetainyl-CoA:carnitine CoA-transferase CaiB-like acyl-CoA transferase
MSTALAALVNQAGNALATSTAPTRMGNAHPSIAPYELFATADRPIIIAVGSDRHFRLLCSAVGLEAMADDDRFDTNPHRVANRAALKKELEAVLATRTCDRWVELLRGAGIPVGPVNSVMDALSFADEIGLEPLVTISEGARTSTSVRSPIRLSESPSRYELAPPRLGEHSGSEWFDMERSTDE